VRALVYLVGEPGAGKSTLMRRATVNLARLKVDKPLAHELLIDARSGSVVGCELGYNRGTFSGTDALGMSAVVPAEALLASPPAPLVLGEGARLGVRRFLQAAVSLGYDVTLVYLTTPHAAAQRERRGAGQSESWVKGAATRARNLADAAIPGVRRVDIDGSRPDAVERFRDEIDRAREATGPKKGK
jgi:hypothetical protein